jgi:N utilization substance protein B
MAAARGVRGRSAARLAAVQALYQMELADSPADAGIADVLARAREASGSRSDRRPPVPDETHLCRVVQGVADDRAILDAAIAEALSADLALDRLEVILRAILRAGAFELRTLPEIPFKVVINEYVEVARAFFAAKEPPLVNAVLDRLAARFRDDEWRQARAVVGRGD